MIGFLQALCLYQIGVCYLCFDNIFCIMCLHLASQFRILQYRMANMFCPKGKGKYDETNESTELLSLSNEHYSALKNCVRQHQALIEFSVTLENIFRIVALGQVLMFSILLCFVGYQVLLVSMHS